MHVCGRTYLLVCTGLVCMAVSGEEVGAINLVFPFDMEFGKNL